MKTINELDDLLFIYCPNTEISLQTKVGYLLPVPIVIWFLFCMQTSNLI
jgi:hypothetical protein